MKQQTEPVNGERSSPERWENILREHLDFIEKQCFKGVSRKWISPAGNRSQLELENVSLELFNRVLDKLKENKYEILRKFQGKAKWTTYLTTVIANQLIDMIRKTMGRPREKERAKKHGKTGLFIHERVMVQGMPVEEVFRLLKREGMFPGTLEELDDICRDIRGNPAGNLQKNDPVVRDGIRRPESGDVVVPDEKGNPEDVYMNKNRDDVLSGVLDEMVESLSGDERMMIRMRFLGDAGGGAKSVDEIAAATGLNKKTVYKRISRILAECKKKLKTMGIRYSDFF